MDECHGEVLGSTKRDLVDLELVETGHRVENSREMCDYSSNTAEDTCLKMNVSDGSSNIRFECGRIFETHVRLLSLILS